MSAKSSALKVAASKARVLVCVWCSLRTKASNSWLWLLGISIEIDNTAIVTQPGQDYLNVVDVPHCFSDTCGPGGVGDECPSLELGKDGGQRVK